MNFNFKERVDPAYDLQIVFGHVNKISFYFEFTRLDYKFNSAINPEHLIYTHIVRCDSAKPISARVLS